MKTLRITGWLVAVMMAAGTLLAQDLDAVKARMVQRKPQIQAILASGTAGENRQGYLEARGTLAPAQAGAMAAENSDRKAVYEAIARKTGANVAQVGRQRAADIAAKAAKGTWVQQADGKWAQK